MGSKAATAGPQLPCVLFCLAALLNLSPTEAPRLYAVRRSPPPSRPPPPPSPPPLPPGRTLGHHHSKHQRTALQRYNCWLMSCCLWLHCLQSDAGSHLTEPLCCPEVLNRLFEHTLSLNIHATVPEAYLASIQEISPGSVVTRHAFLMSVAGKTTVRLAAGLSIIGC